MDTTAADLKETLITLTSDIVAAHVSNNSVAVDELATLISNVFGALAGLGEAAPAVEAAPPKPAVSIRASVKPDKIICLEDGMELKMLKRHLMTHHGMTPEDYRARWNLPADYPMDASKYAEYLRDNAKKIGLGRKPGAKAAAKPAAKPAAKRGRKPKAE
jgi:predicted transcriptional regulator